MELESALRATRVLVCFSVLIQMAEYWVVRKAICKVYAVSVIRQEFPRPFKALILDFNLLILCTALSAALGLIPLVFVGVLLICARFRGTFNGGSDAMTLAVLGPLAVASVSPPWVQRGCLNLIAVQVMLSYFISGVVKLRQPEWRSGLALKYFFERSYYGVPGFARACVQNPEVSRVLSWATILFECGFPLALLDSTWTLVALVLGFIFHLANAVVFGLNRFWLAWLAGYPAVIFFSHFLEK